MDLVTNTGGLAAPAATAPGGTLKAKVTSTKAGVPAAPAFKDDLTRAKERLQPVAHRGYSKITSGERQGEYLNTSGNKRDGEAFTLEYHGGRRWHVYGTGAGRQVVAFAKPGDKTPHTGATTAPAATATTPAAVTSPAVPATPAATDAPAVVPAPSAVSPGYTDAAVVPVPVDTTGSSAAAGQHTSD